MVIYIYIVIHTAFYHFYPENINRQEAVEAAIQASHATEAVTGAWDPWDRDRHEERGEKSWAKHGKTIGKTIGKTWENHKHI